MSKRLLLLSNSTNPGEAYLSWPVNFIEDFLGSGVKKVLFIPYAGVGFSYDDYTDKVREALVPSGYQFDGIHQAEDPIKAIKECEALAIGGGNTFRLLQLLQEQGLVDPIRERVQNGMPYMGWSAGSNVATASLKTTNDMPIAQPQSFEALRLLDIQINPHFTNATLPNHGGESRQQRIKEFLALHHDSTVLGLEESTLLEVADNKATLKGNKQAFIFRYNQSDRVFNPGDDLSELL